MATNDSDPWERQELETAKAYEAFCCYRDFGLERSAERVAAELRKSLGLIYRWSANWNWVSRCIAYDAYMERRARKLHEKEREKEHRREIEEFGKRQRQAAQLLYGVSMKALAKLIKKVEQVDLDELKVSDIRAIAAAIGEARDSEATALGLPELMNEIRSELHEEDSGEADGETAAGSP